MITVEFEGYRIPENMFWELMKLKDLDKIKKAIKTGEY